MQVIPGNLIAGDSGRFVSGNVLANKWILASATTSQSIKDVVNSYAIARLAVSQTYSIASYMMVSDKLTNTSILSDFGLNLFDARYVDSAKRISWYGSITATNTNGIIGNGVNGYGDTYVNDTIDFSNDFCIIWYCRTNEDRNDYLFGAISSGYVGISTQLKVGGNTYYYARTGQTNAGALNRTDGFFSFKLSGNTLTLKRNNVLIYSVTITQQAKQNLSFYLLAANRAGTANLFSIKAITHFELMPFAPTPTQETGLYNAVLSKETSMGRNV